MTPAATRRTIAAVAVWILGLLLVLGMWLRVDAACDDPATWQPVSACAATPHDEVTTVVG